MSKKHTTKKHSAPKLVEGTDLASALNNAMRAAAAEQARFDAMSDADKAAYIEEQRKKQAEVEEILKELRGPGFVELRVFG